MWDIYGVRLRKNEIYLKTLKFHLWSSSPNKRGFSQGYSARRALSSASIMVRLVWIPLSSERKPKMELN